MSIQKISGNIVDVLQDRIYPGTIIFSNGKIVDIIEDDIHVKNYIIPGFVDSHFHIESTMLTPAEFARIAVTHGTVGVVADPHEIANVLGIDGVKYMIENAEQSPLNFFFGAPSCVPATPFETSGAILGAEEVEQLLRMDKISHLGELMNFPGVINDDPLVLKKIALARKYSKKIDGHAPGLRGDDLKKYVNAGISTDHECTELGEALEKLELGMKIIIRESSACKDFDTLIPIAEKHYDQCMFACDDQHPDDLVIGNINVLVKKALKYGLDIMKVLRIASFNPVNHYGLDVGLLRIGDDADFLVIDNFEDLNILQTFIKGKLVAENGKTLLQKTKSEIVNNFKTGKKSIDDFFIRAKDSDINVIHVKDGEILTGKVVVPPVISGGFAVTDPAMDLLKIAVVNRYQDTKPAVGFVKGFGLRRGAIASSVAHDSHNIITVGVDDGSITSAVNTIIEHKGGICVVDDVEPTILPLPIAGIICDLDYLEIALKYEEIDLLAKKLGSKLKAPFMMLSFLALLVIPEIKMSDKGLFDGNKFEFIEVFT